MIDLRDYQERLIDDIDHAHAGGARNVLAVSPTGSGKTVTFSALVGRQALSVATMVHRVELVSQISMTYARFGIRHRLIAPAATIRSIRNEHFREFGRTFDNPTAIHAVASVDTLMSRAPEYKQYGSQVRYWITDEAGHVLRDNKWGVACNMFPNAMGIGFTATPRRADGKGLGRASDGIFDEMILGPTVGQLIGQGHLSRYKIIAKRSDMDLTDLQATASGDFSQQKLRVRSHQSHIVGDVVETYQRFAAGKQGITFTVDVETANEMAERFRAAGVPAAAVSAATPEGERQDAVRAFRNGELRQLTNCDLFGEGFDVPGVECVSLARPTMSLSLHLQQVGRALRPAPGKEHALILDHVGNWEQHGLPDTPRSWSLEPPRKRSSRLVDPDAIKLTTCLECFLVFERKLLPVCPYCGARRNPEARSGPEHVDGDLQELDPAVLAALRESVELETPESVGARVAQAAGRIAGRGAYNKQQARIEAQKSLQDAIALWAGIRKARGVTDSESYREFYLTYGVDVLTAQTLQRAEMDDLRERLGT